MDEATAGFLGHCDWVNDVALLGVGLIASCSSDRTIHVSSTKATGQCLMTIQTCTQAWTELEQQSSSLYARILEPSHLYRTWTTRIIGSVLLTQKG